MARYRLRQVEVDAFQFSIPMPGMMPTWLLSAMLQRRVRYSYEPTNAPVLLLETPDGTVVVPLNSWIVQNTSGDITWCSEETFRAVYEPLSWDGPGWPTL